MRLRKQRQWDELVLDPQTPYMIGRLLGAHEMAVVILGSATIIPAPEAALMVNHVAEALQRVGGYFLEEKLELRTAVLPGPTPPYDQDTRTERPLT